MFSERAIQRRVKYKREVGMAAGKISKEKAKPNRAPHYRDINFNTYSLRYSGNVGLNILGGRMPEEFKRECGFMETIYSLALGKKDYTKIKGLLKDISAFLGYIDGCKKNPEAVPTGIMECLPGIRKKMNDLETKVRKALRDAEANV